MTGNLLDSLPLPGRYLVFVMACYCFPLPVLLLNWLFQAEQSGYPWLAMPDCLYGLNASCQNMIHIISFKFNSRALISHSITRKLYRTSFHSFIMYLFKHHHYGVMRVRLAIANRMIILLAHGCMTLLTVHV